MMKQIVWTESFYRLFRDGGVFSLTKSFVLLIGVVGTDGSSNGTHEVRGFTGRVRERDISRVNRKLEILEDHSWPTQDTTTLLTNCGVTVVYREMREKCTEIRSTPNIQRTIKPRNWEVRDSFKDQTLLKTVNEKSFNFYNISIILSS